MQPKIEEVLAEANLSDAQIGQITTAVGDQLAAVRTAHIEEVASIEKSKDAVIGGLMRDLVESKRLLEEAMAKPVAPTTLVEAVSVRDGSLSFSAAGTELVFEGKVEGGNARRVSIAIADSAELAECALALPVTLDEKVVTKPRRIVATNGNSAVGIDLDAGGTLAFTVTDPEGSSLFELSRPDSEAVKDWFRMLQEAKAVPEKKPVKDNASDETPEELEERVRAKLVVEVNSMLAEALRPFAPMVRRAKDHEKMRHLVESLHTEFGKVLGEVLMPATPAQLTESVEQAARAAAAEESNKNLAEENLALRTQMLFVERTTGMAQTTRERVQMVVEAARPSTLQDYADLLEVAIQSVKPAPEAVPVQKQEQAKPGSTLMESVLAKL